MKMFLRNPVPTDYAALASWIPDERSSRNWAGQMVSFPFAGPLEDLLRIEGATSYSLEGSESFLLGFGQFWPRGEGWFHLGRIIVSPEHRGCGFGKVLVRLLIDKAVEEFSPERITLRVYSDNRPAVSVYRSLGLKKVDEQSTSDLLFMEWKAEQIGAGNSG